ncbi:hypothetical protein LIER_16459 [Lithospermum erythrorhizon]|uniref:non-specific serine/threonine protein kinase n=1 Tax=Lithospermum erythrorhizon TaxID=34254 RepID=A0AAV3QB82_LITER
MSEMDIDMKNLKVMSPLGRGAKGVVFLVEKESSMLALKAILRSAIENKKNIDSKGDENVYKRIFFERQVLSSFQHPLLPKLHGVVSTDKIIGYVIDYCPGGDFNSLRKKQTEQMFSDDIIRFYAAELVLALDYLHGLGIAYRDLKPENVMIQENGHLMLVDFDLSTKLTPKTSNNTSPIHKPPQKPKIANNKKSKFVELFKCFSSEILKGDIVYPADRDSSSSESNSMEKCNSFVGTEEYVSPEVIIGNGHDFAVDWWCLGVMMYEMLYGKTPFRGQNRKETFYRILSEEPELTGESTPLRDLIKKLLEKDPKKRICVDEIKGHDFFKDVDWNFLLEIPRPPFIPEGCDVEGKLGNREIDVENYVKGVFENKEGDDEKLENCDVIGEKKKGGNDEGYNRNNINHGVWVQGLNYPTTQPPNDNFLVF